MISKLNIRSKIQLGGLINIVFMFIYYFVHNYFNFCQHKAHIKLIPSAGNAFLKLEQITRTHNRTKQNKATTTKKKEQNTRIK